MGTISLAGRVAVVTGAGRGLGKAYAELLAARGAAVVVNDLGTAVDGSGRDSFVAEAVAEEIRSRGGQAVAESSGVETAEGGEAIVETALRSFGRIDILVTNAGIVGNQPFADATLADFEQYWRVHLGGTVNVLKPAWPHLLRQRYGRIITVESSAGLYGLEGQATYAAAKGAIHGLMRTLALEGRPQDVLVNSIMPGGFSRMMEAALEDRAVIEWMRKYMAPDLVAAVVLWLSSDRCSVTGETFSAWAGRVARVAIGSGTGLFSPELKPEEVDSEIDQIMSPEGWFAPKRNIDEITNWLSLGLIPAAP